MSILHGGLLGALLGETPSTQYDVRAYQEKVLREMMMGMQPFGGSQLGANPPRPRKFVESREVSPREIARKQIQGAVKEAQETAK